MKKKLYFIYSLLKLTSYFTIVALQKIKKKKKKNRKQYVMALQNIFKDTF